MEPTNTIHEIHHCLGVTIRALRVHHNDSKKGELISEKTFTDAHDDEPGTPEVRARAWGEGFAACLRAMGGIVAWKTTDTR